MGETKEQLTPEKKPEAEKGGVFSKLAKRRNKSEKDSPAPERFVDMIAAADDALDNMIINKTQDLEKEKGKEGENRQKIHILRTMQFHLDSIIEAAQAYHEV